MDDGSSEEDESWRPRKVAKKETTKRRVGPAQTVWRRTLEAKLRERRRGVWREFGRQVQAFEYVDSWLDTLDFHECRVQEKPRLWAMEIEGGKRRYVVAHWDRFCKEYEHRERYFSELIREGSPVRPYFDLEYAKKEPRDDKPELVDKWIDVFTKALSEEFQCGVQNILQLDATTATKFSRHLIFHLDDGALFLTTTHLGAFVRDVFNRSELVHDFVDAFVDLSVYTKNRLFRLAGSAKRGKNNPFVRVDGGDDHLLPPDSLVVPLTTEQSPPRRYLRYLDDDDKNKKKQTAAEPPRVGGGGENAGGESRRWEVIASGTGPSPFPLVDEYVLASRPGARLRKWERHRGPPSNPYDGNLVFHLAGNRYCENIGREHKSNNIFQVIDLRNAVMIQRCHDAGSCRGFNGFPVPLPQRLKDYIIDAILDELTS